MKKYVILVVLFSLVLLWCNKKNDITLLDPATITDLSTLESVILQVWQEMNDWTLAMEQAWNLIHQLQQRYIDLSTTTDQTIEDSFATLQKTFDKNAIIVYWLPLWAKKLGMTEPQGMELNKSLSKEEYANDTGYGSTVLVYTWEYTIALQQAKIIAEKAHLSVSKNYQQAQSIAQVGNVDYISGLDMTDLNTWIIYVNHELLDTNLDQFLSVSVHQDGTLTIEATKYKNK